MTVLPYLRTGTNKGNPTMDIFDKILPFLILIIYIISIFWKKRNRDTGEDTPAEKSSGAQKWLENLMGQISEEIAPPKPETPPDPTRVVRKKNAGKKKPSPISETRAQKDRTAIQAAKNEAPPPPERKRKPDPVVLKTRRSSGPAYSRKMLQDRIIWAEILGPPVALREKDHR